MLATFVFMSTKARANARATTPWGDAALVDQLEIQQRAGERRFASVVQLLENGEG